MTLSLLSSHRCFDGTLSYYRHWSDSNDCAMRFTIFLPPQTEAGNPVPVITYLSGLTCTEENFTIKAGAYRTAAALGLAILTPDTSPRGENVYDEPAEAIGKGAGFYINATEEPWALHYQMETYITQELNALLAEYFPVNLSRHGIMGHSMGGHGALTLFFRRPNLYRSVSALAPIVNPTAVPWCQTLFSRYLGANTALWKQHDACELVKQSGAISHTRPILIDQGTADSFLGKSLHPELFETACKEAGQALTLRYQPDYDHSYFFVQSFIEDHLRHHHALLERQ